MSPTPTSPAGGLAEGERRRDAALQLLRDRRAIWVRRGRRALLRRLLDAGTATADDVRAAVTLPPDLDPRCMGAVPGELADAGIIRPAGYVRTARPAGHARPVLCWHLADRTAALVWLAAHPHLPDPDDGESVQRSLWDD
jgi:hypothetical protein